MTDVQVNTAVKNTTRKLGQKYYSWKKIQIKKGSKTLQILPKAATHPTKYGKANSKQQIQQSMVNSKQQIQQSMVKQTAKNAKLGINDTEKKNVEKKK